MQFYNAYIVLTYISVVVVHPACIKYMYVHTFLNNVNIRCLHVNNNK